MFEYLYLGCFAVSNGLIIQHISKWNFGGSQCFAGVRKYVSLIVSIFIHTSLMAGSYGDVGRA